MAFAHSIFALANHTANKYSAILAVKHNPEQSCHSKTQLVTINGKGSEAHAQVLEKAKRELVSKARQNVNQGLSMVDSIQRLGIEHHFEEEIEAILKRAHLTRVHRNDDCQELSQVALLFRLLRQEGYYIHPDMFDKFRDHEGNLKQALFDDIQGLTGLFEASQLSIEGEEYLDQAGELSRRYLNVWLSSVHDHPHLEVVTHSLRSPIHKSLSLRFMPKFLQFEKTKWTNSLEELSKFDSEIIGSLHLKEIFEVSKWWKELGLAKDLKFARDEPIKWYMWAMACLPDPQFSEERIELTKPLSLVYLIDDIFDFCGNIDELTVFTDAVKRWDMEAMEQLPDYMKVCFKALYDLVNEFAFKTQLKLGWNPLNTLIKSWGRLLSAFLEEAKWFASGEIPKADEYLKNGIVSTGVHMILVHSFFFMGQGITDETVTLMDEFPSLISSTATILRLCDDLEGDNEDDGDGMDGSYLKCYMKEHPGVSIEQTREHVRKLISDAWKRLNQECLNKANPLPSSFTKVCLNAARMVPLMYSHDTNTPSQLEDYVKSLLSGGGYMQSVPKDQNVVS
ncbi:hypothetical protein RJT34_04293 [Clitoria ternatea]|uniref:Uncharacterized protein n=1 Tax=Clitoria ternatea TaxID=43366 RepID=A0AAN9KKN8_CLITE